MNVQFNKYQEAGMSLDLNLLKHDQKFVVHSLKNPELQVLWSLCEKMEEEALHSFYNAAVDFKLDSFCQTAKMEYILRPGYHRVMKNLVLKEVYFFISTQCIWPHYAQKDVCYACQLCVDGKYASYSFVFEKQ